MPVEPSPIGYSTTRHWRPLTLTSTKARKPRSGWRCHVYRRPRTQTIASRISCRSSWCLADSFWAVTWLTYSLRGNGTPRRRCGWKCGHPSRPMTGTGGTTRSTRISACPMAHWRSDGPGCWSTPASRPAATGYASQDADTPSWVRPGRTAMIPTGSGSGHKTTPASRYCVNAGQDGTSISSRPGQNLIPAEPLPAGASGARGSPPHVPAARAPPAGREYASIEYDLLPVPLRLTPD